MASISTTELNATIQELWDQKVADAFYATGVILPRVYSKSKAGTGKGDSIHLSYKNKYTAGDVGANGICNAQTTTPTSVNLIMNVYKQVTVEVELQADAVSFWNPMSSFPTDAGYALTEAVETSLASLYSSLTSNVVGSAGSPTLFDKDMALLAMLKLADRNVIEVDKNAGQLSWIVNPKAVYLGLYKDAALTSAHSAGVPKNVLTTGYKFPLVGVPLYVSTLVQKSGTANAGMLLSKETLAAGFAMNKIYRQGPMTAANYLKDIGICAMYYGVVAFRENTGVVCYYADPDQ